MTASDPDPAAPDGASGGSRDEVIPERDTVQTSSAGPEDGSGEAVAAPGAPAPTPRATSAATPDADDAPGSAWLASAEGLVPKVPAAHRHWSPEPDPPGELDFEGTRVLPHPKVDADDWGWRPATPEPGPEATSSPADPPATFHPSPRDPRAYDPNAYAPSGYDDPARGSWAVAPSPPSPAGPGAARPVPPPPMAPARPGPGKVDPRLGKPDPYVAAYGAPVSGVAAWSAARSRRRFPVGRLLLAFVLGLLLAVFVAGGALYAYDQQYVGRILPGVRVGNLDLSGMEVAAARDRIAQEYAVFGQGKVVVSLAGQTTEIAYSDFDRRVDANRLAIEAFAVGRAAGPLDRLLGELRTITRGVTLQPTVLLDAASLEARVRAIARAAESNPVDASAIVTATGFATTPSKTGQRVDEGTAAGDAAARLAAIDAPERIDITLTATPLPPAVSDASAQVASSQATLMNNDVTLVDGKEQWTVPAATVHSWLSFTVINNRARIVIDAKAVLADLKPLAKKVDRAAVSATIKLSGGAIAFGKPSVDGRTLNASRTTTAVVNALRNRALGNLAVDATIAPVLTITKPALTTAQAKAAVPLMKPISTWTTNYQPSERNGNGANIRIPTATINGYVLGPGETFSFWKAVGPVTRELGYTDGGAIIDGHTEPQGALGGGICSCSTTLFNAALRAGYDMGDRLNHFYYINRYPLGLDATVFISASGQAQDMTFTNDSEYPVVIGGTNGKAFVRFTIYSVPNGRTTTFTDPIVKNYTRAHTETRVDKSLPKGTRKQIEYATDGQDVWVTRTVKDKTGAVLHKETFYSHYATITGIILTNP